MDQSDCIVFFIKCFSSCFIVYFSFTFWDWNEPGPPTTGTKGAPLQSVSTKSSINETALPLPYKNGIETASGKFKAPSKHHKPKKVKSQKIRQGLGQQWHFTVCHTLVFQCRWLTQLTCIHRAFVCGISWLLCLHIRWRMPAQTHYLFEWGESNGESLEESIRAWVCYPWQAFHLSLTRAHRLHRLSLAMSLRTNAAFLAHYSSFQFYSQLYCPSRRNSFGVTILISIRKSSDGWLVTELLWLVSSVARKYNLFRP